MLTLQEISRMTRDVWLGQLVRAVRGRLPDVKRFGPGRQTTLELDGKSATLHQADEAHASLSFSLASGGPVGGRMEDETKPPSISNYEIDGSTVLTVAGRIVDFLVGEKSPLPRTLRDNYRILDFLNGDKHSEQGRLRERFLNLRYMSIPLGDHKVRLRNDDATDINHPKEMSEVIAFGHLAVSTGLDVNVRNIVNCKPPEPDLRIELEDGSHVFVEVGQVKASESPKYFGAIDKVNQHLRWLEMSDSAYFAEIQGRHVSVRLPTAPPTNRSREAADEIVKLLRSIDFETVQRKSLLKVDKTNTPYLASLGATYGVGDGISTNVGADSTAYGFDPEESVRDLYSMLAKKLKRTYATDAPLWLALPLTDLKHDPSLSMKAMRNRMPTEMGQFERILFGTMEDAQVVHRQH